MSLVRDTFCSFCGARHVATGYPRTCPSCEARIWANPIPVSVVLAPVVKSGREGILVVRRGIEPQKGRIALVGGFLEEHESWAEGGAREVREEAGATIDPKTLTTFWFASSEPRPNRVLLFSVAPAVDASALAPFVPNDEAPERGLVFGPDGIDSLIAFPLHVDALRRYFASRGITGPTAYETV